MFKRAEVALDMRNQNFNIGLFEGGQMTGKSGASRQEFQVFCDYNEQEVGSLMFYVYNGWPLNKIDPVAYSTGEISQDFIYIKEIRVHDKYQNMGIGQLLYKKFGEVYGQKFNNFSVGVNYANPIAEYAYRKAISLGYIPRLALNENYISREYNSNEEKSKAKDLRNKLPENVQGPEVWASIEKKAVETMIDIRNLVCDYSINENDLEDADSEETHKIALSLHDGTRIGHLVFTAYENVRAKNLNLSNDINDFIERLIYVESLWVADIARNNGIATEMYRKFGEIYNQEYLGWPVGREFVNPVAEYTYRKAVSIGLIPEESLSEEYIKRNYKGEKSKAKDLRNKLPEDVRGPKVWASINKIALDTMIDVRNLVCDYSTKEVSEGPVNGKTHIITLYLADGTKVSNLVFTAYENVPAKLLDLSMDINDLIEKIIHVELLWVSTIVRKNGIATEMYRKFGEIYNQEYSGWSVTREFVNPVAEYTYRKAISMGLIPEDSLSEEYIRREYNDESMLQAVDLRNKLPENVRGPEYWASKQDVNNQLTRFANDDLIDIRDLEYGHTVRNYDNYNFYEIQAFHPDEGKVASLTFGAQFKNQTIEIDNIEVERDFRKLGIATKLYQRAGEIYTSEYNGWIVKRTFIDPIAEYSVRKAISLGYVPENFLQEEYIERSYSENSSNLVTDLRNKLPEEFRGNFAKLAFQQIEENEIDYDVNDVVMRDIKGNELPSVNINISYDDQQVGYMIFSVFKEEKRLYIENIEVWDVYQGLGLAKYLYKKFGEIYKDRYNGWIVEREFQNPAAENAFNKAIELGWVPQEALNEEYTRRNYA